VAEGHPSALDDFATWCRQGPPLARVNKVESTDEPVEGLGSFDVRH